MKQIRIWIPAISLLLFNGVFAYAQTIPAELCGKWKLRAANSKLIGSFEISSNGMYTYSVAPSYKETGKITLNAGVTPKQIDMKILAVSKQKVNLTKGIYQLTGNTLLLCLGKLNGARPLNFDNAVDPSVVLWRGSK